MNKTSKAKFINDFNRYSPKNIKKGGDIYENRFLYREKAAEVAYHLSKIGISANMVTMLSFLLQLLGCMLLIYGKELSFLLILILNEVALFLDCVDGPLARYYKNNLVWGKILDNFLHTLISSIFIISFSLRLYAQSNNNIYLILGMVGATSYILDIKWLETLKENQKSKVESKGLNNFKSLLRIFDDIALRLIIIFILDFFSHTMNLQYITSLFFVMNICYIFLSKIVYRGAVLFKRSIL